MTRDEIIKLAREAGFGPSVAWKECTPPFERFAALVEQHLIASGYRKCAVGQRTTQFCGQLEQAVLAEREALVAIINDNTDGDGVCCADDLLEAIRARGEK